MRVMCSFETSTQRRRQQFRVGAAKYRDLGRESPSAVQGQSPVGILGDFEKIELRPPEAEALLRNRTIYFCVSAICCAVVAFVI